jgi:hypothetical protein
MRSLKKAFISLVAAVGFVAPASAAERSSDGVGGLIVTGSGEIAKQLELQRTVYFGGCPGEKVEPVEAWFKSNTLAGSPGSRVTVTNVTPGINGNPFPYTDREYEDADRSEHTFLAPSRRHHGQTLSIVDGVNQFRYSIYRERQVVETGAFELAVSTVTSEVQRDPELVWELVCDPHSGSIPQCMYRATWRCPY